MTVPPLAPPVPRADFLPAAEVAALRQRHWTLQSAYAAAASPFLRRLWNGQPPPARLEALPSLPLCDKEMLRADQRAHPPFGSYLAAPPERVCRLHRTSGTTGQAMNLALSAHDTVVTAAAGARALSASGAGPGHRVVHCLNYRLWMGGYTDHASLEATGATVIPFGVGKTELLIRTIRELGATAISCTPSYPAVIEQVLAERFAGLQPRDLGLRLGLFGGEAALDDSAFRRRLEEVWGFAARNANYGVTDILCTFAGQCERSDELHFVAPDLLHAELIEPETATPLAWAAGARGELVLTHLSKECQPLVRFRTGDIVAITGMGACACGRTATRFRVVGRADDMVVVRGINVFPTMVAAVLGSFAGLSGEYRIPLEGRGPYDRLPIEAEMAAGREPAPDLAEAVAAAVRWELGVTARVTLLPYLALPRTAGKTRRVLRLPEAAPA